MAKRCNPDLLDLLLNGIKTGSGTTGPATRLSICSAEPTTYTEAVTTYMLILETIDSADFTGPANGDGSGNTPRKLTMSAQNGITVTNSGTATHAAWSDSANSKLLEVTTVVSQSVTAANLANVSAFKCEISAPT